MEQTVIYRNLTINIEQDDCPVKPDEFGNDDIFLIYDHRSFYVKVNGFDPTEIWEWINENPTKKLYRGYWVFPVYAYIHSGVSLSLGSLFGGCDPGGWDTSMKGFTLVKRLIKWSWKHKEAVKVADSLITEWNDYLSGNVYGFEIPFIDESCYGYYGDPEKSGLIEEAKSAIDYYIKNKIKKRITYLKNIIHCKVPLIYRKEFKLC